MESLGKVVMDWGEMSMVFNNDGKMVKFKCSSESKKKGRGSQLIATLQGITEGEMRHVEGLKWPMMRKADLEQQENWEPRQQTEMGTS